MDEENVLKARRDEVAMLKERIGWSWQTLGERIGLTISQSTQLRTLKRPIADSDLDYLRAVASAIDAVQRMAPAPADATQTREVDPMLTMGRGGPETLGPSMFEKERARRMQAQAAGGPRAGQVPHLQPGLESPAQIPVATVARQIAAAYLNAEEDTQLTPEQLEGARWAIGLTVEALGLTAEVRAMVAAMRKTSAGAPLPQADQTPRAEWAPPAAAAPASRMPF